MFSKVLIANRGEIACRVIRTARRLGIATVAVHSEADTGSLAVDLADEAVHIGPSPAAESYLNAERIVATAVATGAQAVHPGFGFLSENAGFAEACDAAGLVFIGPPADAIRAMGSKSRAKDLMGGAGVPLTPGYHGDEQDPAQLEEEADRIGYPVLIKASAGGGGKGMRLVTEKSQFAEALASCKREAAASFGDDHCLIERYVTRPRHIEMQVFADAHGNAVHLFERDCSIQRRHQKVLEEATAPAMTPELRDRMGIAATDAARAVGYRGAGTVEFIVETDETGAPGDFFFMEMNTRLQVEHPVTEAITGQDLVEWQFRVAFGEPLPLAQDEIIARGHAIEARLYAENPDSGFLPSTGTLRHLVLPEGLEGVRVDTGVRPGDEVSPYYDPMIAKIIAHGADRGQAAARLAAALRATEVAGPTTNRDFLLRCIQDRDFLAGVLDTGFIERKAADLLAPVGPAPVATLFVAALAILLRRADASLAGSPGTSDPHSPWNQTNGWRLNGRGYSEITFEDGSEFRTVRCDYRETGYRMSHGDDAAEVSGALLPDNRLDAAIGGLSLRVAVVLDRPDVTVVLGDGTYRLRWPDPMARFGADEGAAGTVTAPMPGKITAVLSAAEKTVSAGQPLLVLEAMKMEHTIKAPKDGTISELRVSVGDQVTEGSVLVTFEDDA